MTQGRKPQAIREVASYPILRGAAGLHQLNNNKRDLASLPAKHNKLFGPSESYNELKVLEDSFNVSNVHPFGEYDDEKFEDESNIPERHTDTYFIGDEFEHFIDDDLRHEHEELKHSEGKSPRDGYTYICDEYKHVEAKEVRNRLRLSSSNSEPPPEYSAVDPSSPQNSFQNVLEHEEESKADIEVRE